MIYYVSYIGNLSLRNYCAANFISRGKILCSLFWLISTIILICSLLSLFSKTRWIVLQWRSFRIQFPLGFPRFPFSLILMTYLNDDHNLSDQQITELVSWELQASQKGDIGVVVSTAVPEILEGVDLQCFKKVLAKNIRQIWHVDRKKVLYRPYIE